MSYHAKFFQAIVVPIAIIGLGMLSSCGSGSTKKPAESQSDAGLANAGVDEVFTLSRDYARDAKNMAGLKKAYGKLNTAHKKQLAQKSEKGFGFARHLCRGVASEDSAQLLDDFLGSIGPQDASKQVRGPGDTTSCMNLLLMPSQAHAGEQPSVRVKEIAAVLPYDPEQVNKINEGSVLNEVVSTLEDKGLASPVVKKLESKQLKKWLAWAVANRDLSKNAFKAIHTESGTDKALMQNQYLAKAYEGGSAEITKFLNDLGALGLLSGLDSDVDYELAKSATSSDKFKGSLLSVLARRLKADNARAPDALRPLADLRTFSGIIKTYLKGQYLAHVKVKRYDDTKTLVESLGNDAQTKHLLNLEAESKPDEVMSEASRLGPNDDPSELLALFNSTITTPAGASKLASLTHGADGFVQKLVRLKASDSTRAMLKSYLALLGLGAKNPSPNASSESALSILVDPARATLATEDVPARNHMILELTRTAQPAAIKRLALPIVGNFLTLIANIGEVADITKVLSATDAQADDDVARFSQPHLLLAGPNKVKLAYGSAYNAADPARQQAMRSALLKLAYNDPARVVKVGEFITLMQNLDPNPGTATYKLGTNAVSTLLQVFTEQAIKDNTNAGNNRAAYDQLRSLALLLKGNPAYAAQFALAKTRLDAALTPQFAGFARYYLDLDGVQGLMEAAKTPQVSNAGLQELFNKVLAQPLPPNDVRLQALAQKADPGPMRFIHYLAARPAHALPNNLMLFQFLGSLGANERKAQIALPGAAGNVLRILLGNRPTTLGQDPQLNAVVQGIVGIDDGSALSTLADKAQISRLFNEAGNSPAGFNALITKPNLSPGLKVQLRSALLASMYPLQLINLINTHATYGLNLATDTFNLAHAGDPNKWYTGSLLYVLTKRAIEESKSGNAQAYMTLRGYAGALKLAMQPSPASFEAHAMAAVHAAESSFKALNDELGGPNRGKANFYLQVDELKGLMGAAADGALSRADLRALYDLVIGPLQPGANPKTAALALLPGVPGDKFIHLVAKRRPDANTMYLLRRFLDGVSNDAIAHGVSAPGAVQAQIASPGVALAQPLNMLLAQNAVPANDQPMLDTIQFLVNNANHAAIDAMNMSELVKRCFALEASNGRVVFQTAYGKANAGNRELMRDALLALLVKDPATADANIVALIGPTNAWGLRASLDGDTYKLAGGTRGNLLTVLTERAIGLGAHRAGAKPAYAQLQAYAQHIRASINATRGADDYIRQAIGAVWGAALNTPVAAGSPLALLRLDLQAYPGFAEDYLLVLDARVAGIDAALLNRAVEARARMSDAKLTDVYNAVVKPGQANPEHRLAAVFAGADEAALAKLFAWIFADRAKLALAQAAFKHALTHAPTAAAKTLLASALLQNRYDAGQIALRAFIGEITDVHNDIWGLKAHVATDLYTLSAHKPGAPKITGSLLYVLAKRIAEAHTAKPPLKSINKRDLSDYAQAIKAVLDALGPGPYTMYAQTAVRALGDSARAKILLHLDLVPQDVMDEAARLAAYTIKHPRRRAKQEDLQTIYNQVIAGAPEALALTVLAPKTMRHFINHLVLLPATAITRAILTDFLAKLGPAGAVAQARVAVAGQPTPLEILTDDHRILLFKNPDDPTLRRAMVDSLIDARLGALGLPTIGAIGTPVENLADAKIFLTGLVAGDHAQFQHRLETLIEQVTSDEFFEALMARGFQDLAFMNAIKAAFKAKYPAAGARQPYLRNMLFKHHYERGFTDLRMFIGELTRTDDWGLRDGLAVDDYTLINKAGDADITGPLLYVLAKRVYQDNQAPVKAKNRVTFVNLKELAKRFQEYYLTQPLLDYRNDVSVNQYAGETIVQVLGNDAQARKILGIPDVDNIVADALDLNTSTEELAEEYQKVIDTPAKAKELADKPNNVNGQGVIHDFADRIAKGRSKAGADVIADFLGKLYGVTPQDAANQVVRAGTGADQRTPFQILTDARSQAGGKDANLQAALRALVRFDDGRAIAEVKNLGQVRLLLDTVANQGNTFAPELAAVFARLPNDQGAMEGLAEWTAEHYQDRLHDDQTHATQTTIAELFKDEYNNRVGNANAQKILRNKIVQRAYEQGRLLGSTTAERVQRAIEGVTALISSGVLDAQVFAGRGFYIWQPPELSDSNLLYVVLKQALNDGWAPVFADPFASVAGDKVFVRPFAEILWRQNKFGWALYRGINTNGVARETVEDLFELQPRGAALIFQFFDGFK